MLRSLRQKIARNERLFSFVVSFMLIAVTLVNSHTLGSLLVGIFALGLYLFLNGKMLGRTFFGGEDSFFRLVFGLFLFIILMALMGIFMLVVSLNQLWYLFGMLSATVITFLLSHLLRSRGSNKKSDERESSLKRWYTIPICGSYAVSLMLSLFLLLNVRSGWIRGPIWKVVPPMFLQVYFIATAILCAIVLLPGKAKLKLLCVVLHSIFSLSFVVIILYPGILYYDPWYSLAKAQESTMFLHARLFYTHGTSFRTLNSILKGRISFGLIATFAEALCVDRYWSNVLLMPILYGFFSPLMLYKITEKIGGPKEASLLAAFLTIPNLYLLAWGKITTAASLSILFFLPLVYFMLRFLSTDESFSIRWIFSSSGIKTWLPIFIVFVGTLVEHFLPMVLAISLAVLAFALKKYQPTQARFTSKLLLFSSFVFSVFLLPFATIGRGILIPAIGTSAFSIEKLLDASVWTLVVGVSEEFAVQDALLYHIFPLVGLIGFVYALQRKEIFNKTLCLFLFLVFGVCLLDYRILEYAIVGDRIFGPGRLRVFRDMVALPFASVVTMIVAKSLCGTMSKIRSAFRWRSLLAGTLVCVSLSAWVTAAIYETYEYYTKGLLPTSLEVDAIKYIDEHTNGAYVVLAPHRTAVMGHGFVGYPNYEKMYYSIGRLGAPSEPSVAGMFGLMEATAAEVGYYMTLSWTSVFNETIAEASRVFGLFKIIGDEDNQIYIFNYKIPPLPQSPDVMAFYWDAPSAYYIQNDLVRIIINPMTKTVDIVDFWGDVYESVNLDKALVDDNPVGNLVSIKYYDFQNGEWLVWGPETEIPSAAQFKFNLIFEKDSLTGLLESGRAFIDLWWESGRESTLSLEVGDFARIYIPGLISGKDAYDTNSRKYGFLYTSVHGDNILLQPAYGTDGNSTSLIYSQIREDCGFNLDTRNMFYDLYVLNNAAIDQWVYVEVWLPDEVYTGTFPPFYYSLDSGETWIYPKYSAETLSDEPIRTIGGTNVNWILSTPRSSMETPTRWWLYKKALGGIPILPENFTDSGGAQNRMFFGLYLPAGDKVLLRLGTVVYYVRPLKVSYVFTGSDNTYYGLYNMLEGLIKFYNLDTSSYIGGIKSTRIPLSLTITQDEDDRVNSMSVKLPPDTTFSLLSGKEIDTTIDLDADGIPDYIRID